MVLKGYISLFFTLLICVTSVLHAQNTIEPFEEGMAKVDAGEIEKALSFWMNSVESLDQPDYRIGYNFIKLVAENELKEYYEDASSIYLWGLGGEGVSEEEAKLLEKDLFYLSPLIGQREERDIKREIDDRSPQAYSLLYEFWRELNPTPADSYNERLLEHWERVAYALTNFDTSSRTHYDDRGHKFIKYGAPDRTRDGILMHDPGFANYILATRMDERVDGVGNAASSTLFLNTLYQVRDYHNHASYEVWVYTDLADHANDVPFIFGNDSGGDVMRLRHSVDDFIPSAAYSTGGRNEFYSHGMSSDGEMGGADNADVAANMAGGVSGGYEEIPPAVVLQIMYYRQLATVDDYFSSRYDEMLNRYESTATRLSSSIAREFEQMNISQLQRTQRNAPDNQSSHLNTLHSLDGDIYVYRFLDENLEPYLRVYHDIDTDEAITVEELKRSNNLDDINPDNFSLINHLTIFDENMNSSHFVSDSVTVNQRDVDPLQVNMIKVPHPENTKTVRANFELHDKQYSGISEIAENSTFRQYLKGLGSADGDLDERIEVDGFTLSDIILGFTPASDSDSGMELRISHNREIPQYTSINFYYEVYNVPVNREGLHEFSLTYSIKKDRSLLGRLIRFGGSDEASISIDNVHDNPMFSQQLEIVTEGLETGDYLLELQFYNHENKVEYNREIPFTIIE